LSSLLSGKPGSQSRLGSGLAAGASLLAPEVTKPTRARTRTYLVPDVHAPITADAACSFPITSISDASDAIAGASAGSFAITSIAAAQAAEVASAVGSFAVTSASAAQDAIAAAAVGSFAVTSASDAAAQALADAVASFAVTSISDAAALDTASAVGSFTLVGQADATTTPLDLNADAIAYIVIMSASDAAEAIAADAAGLIIMVGGYEEPAIPDYPTVIGAVWGWYERWQKRIATKAKQAERIHQTRYAVAITEIRIVAHATATTGSRADAAGRIRIVGSSGAMMGSNPADDEEMLLLTMLLERLAA
jgi:hypothetical protein